MKAEFFRRLVLMSELTIYLTLHFFFRENLLEIEWMEILDREK